MELIALFISENPKFFNTYGNYVIIPLLVVIAVVDLVVVNKKISSKKLKWLIRIPLLILSFLLASMVVMANLPLKPMVEALSRVKQNTGKPAPNLIFVNARDGDTLFLSDFRGKVVLLNFWGTFCPPCIKEFPDLIKVEENQQSEVAVLALSDEGPERVIRFIQKFESPAVTGYTVSPRWLELETFRPVTVIIDRDGIVREYFFGSKDYEYFKKCVSKYL